MRVTSYGILSLGENERIAVDLRHNYSEADHMSKVLSATYEGDRLIRLDEAPTDLKPSSRILVLVNPNTELPAATETGLEGLQERLKIFETRYGLSSAEFISQYERGELGDQRDFITWAGLIRLLQRMAEPDNGHE